MLDIRRMKVLREVAAQGSFSAAAEVLSFTQSAVSQHVAALERETGTQLVERLPRGVRLTEAGAVLVQHADVVIARLESAEDDLNAIAGLRGGRLRLVCFQSAGATVVPRAVATFHERHPDVELSMREAEPEEATRMLKAGEVDLALLYHHPAMSLVPDLELTHMMDDRYDALLPASHPLLGRRRLSLKDLADESWIVSTPINGCRTITSATCREAGFEPRVAFEADDTLASQALVAGGVGVTLMPRMALTALHPGAVPRALTDGPRRRVLAARMEGAFHSPASDAMLEILKQAAADFSGPRLELAAS
jgi:DNA-binding transcriptional LysR family regulator